MSDISIVIWKTKNVKSFKQSWLGMLGTNNGVIHIEMIHIFAPFHAYFVYFDFFHYEPLVHFGF